MVMISPDIAQLQMQIETQQRTIETQQRTITAHRNETQWLLNLINNPSFDEVTIRLLVHETPQEVRMGYTHDVPERILPVALVAQDIDANEKTLGRKLRTLSEAKVIAYRWEHDPETKKNRSYVRVLPTVAQPEAIKIDRAVVGGSRWENGKRIKRCACGSDNLIKVTKSWIQCGACGEVQPGSETVKHTAVESHSYYPEDDETTSQIDCRSFASEDSEDMEVKEDSDVSKCPHPLYTQVCIGDDVTPDASEVETTSQIDPCYIPIEVEQVEPPKFLRDKNHFCAWRYIQKQGEVKPSKVPYVAQSGRGYSITSPTDLVNGVTSYTIARDVVEQAMKEHIELHTKEYYDGIGYKLDGTYTAGDEDWCIVYDIHTHQALLRADVYERLKANNTYYEVSPSGAGVRFLIKGSIPGPVHTEIELYCKKRFMSWTGNHIVGTPNDIEERQEQLNALYKEFKKTVLVAPKKAPTAHTPCVYTGPGLSDDAIIEKARTARNGTKFRKLFDEGDISGYSNDESRADLALCKMLAYWTNGDDETIDRLFRQSKLYRSKWERDDYREMTIAKAVA